MSQNEEDLDKLLRDLRLDIQKVRESVNPVAMDLARFKDATNDSFNKVREELSSLREAVNKQNKALAYLDKRISETKADTSAGIVAGVVLFTVLFVVSMFF